MTDESGKIISEQILKSYDEPVWAGFKCVGLTVTTLIQTGYQAFTLNKVLRTSLRNNQLLAFQNRLRSMELIVGYLITHLLTAT